MQPYPTRPRAAVLVLCGLLLAGCSSSHRTAAGATPTAGATSTASATPAASPSPSAAPSATASAPGPVDPLSPAPALESAPPAGRPVCRSSTVTVADADALSSDEGLVEVFALRTSGPDCQLNGYPTVRLLDAAGAPLAVRIDRGGHGLPAPARATTLSRSTSASFELALPSGSSCRSAATVIVRLPGTSTDLRASTAVRVCAAALGVSPVLRRADTENASG